MIRRIVLGTLATGALLTAAGCRHCCRSLQREPRPYLPPAPGGAFLGPSGRTTIPPTNIPTQPGTVPPPAAFVPTDPTPPVNPPPANFRPGLPPASLNLPPLPKGNQELLLPDPLPGGGRSAFPPSGSSPGASLDPAPPRPMASAELPGFTELKPGVAAGQKPTTQGFAELKAKNYRTVAFLHAPGADTSSARELAERQGLAFVPIESSPEKLAEALQKLNGLVADRAAQPLYAYADEGPRAGAVWYLHFRTVDADGSEVAKVKAGGLGLDATSPLAVQFWTAIQAIMVTK